MTPASHVYDGVTWKGEPVLGPFCVVGEPARGRRPEEAPTVFGADAVLRSHTVVYHGNRIGDRFQTGHGVQVREDNTIGSDVSIGSHSVVEHHVEIGDRVRLHSGVFVPEYTVLEEGCWVGPGAVLTNAKYPLSPGVKDRLAGPVIGAGAIIGAAVVLLPGVRIGAGALVGAGAVVARDVASGAVVVGNPARAIKERRELPYGDAA